MSEVEEDLRYKELINKAYIEPIKSVLAIDDQYQSLDTVLSNMLSDSPQTVNAELQRQIETLSMVRENNWLADMHNGQTDTDSAIFDRLHQCDLLLLDYHLDENNPDDPEKALRILSKLNKNHHFNLVIVYTDADNLKNVRTGIFCKLSSSSSKLFNQSTQEAERLLEEWDDAGESYQDDMLLSITRGDLEFVLSNPSILKDVVEFTAIFTPIDLILNAGHGTLSDNVKQQLYIILLELKIKELKESEDFTGDFTVKISGNDSNSIWLKTEKLFIAVISKTAVTPNELPDALQRALQDWRPTNNRLLLSKIKSELDDNGQTFENEILSCEYTNAGWLKQFHEESNGMDITVSRLMEGLSNVLCSSSELIYFSDLMKQRIESIGLPNEIKEESPSIGDINESGNKIELCKALNTYIGTRNVEGNHLMTGHVIEWGDVDPGKREYFLCLTPACELVPGRVNSNNYKGCKSDLDPYLPVKTIRLIKQENESKTLKDINKKPIVVLKIDDGMVCFKAAEDGKSVFHEQIFANFQGKFESVFDIKTVEIHRTFLKDITLTTEKRQCRIVAHLRYEYALSLLQRLGQDLTKIGLDYVTIR